jgi:hypothetical protein
MFTHPIREHTRDYLLTRGRLLERQCYLALFEQGPVEMALKALSAYQNSDGGFGSGIEPDLLTPASTGIGLETACFYLDILSRTRQEQDQIMTLLQRARDWVERQTEESGPCMVMPKDLDHYPHQTWWLSPDQTRLLSIAGYLAKFNLPLRGKAKTAAAELADSLAIPQELTAYNYPLFVYAANETSFSRWETVLDILQQQLTEHIYEERDSYFLLTRYWYHFIDMMPEELVERQVELFFENIEADGGVKDPYPGLPWWRPIVTMDYLMILNSMGLIE